MSRYIYNGDSVEADARVFDRMKASRIAQEKASDSLAVAALRAMVRLLMDMHGREVGSAMVRAVVREELPEQDPQAHHPDR